jgi:hypothetical protein
MKRSIATLAVFTALLFNYSFAQDSKKGGSGTDPKDAVQSEMSNDAATTAKEWTQKMDEICNLDAAQEKKIMEINLRYANKLEELKHKYKGMDNPNSEAAKAEKDDLTKQRLSEYSKVLNKEQMQRFKDYRQQMKGSDDASGSDKKSEVKDKYQSATPEEQEKMKEEMKQKKADKEEKKSTDKKSIE